MPQNMCLVCEFRIFKCNQCFLFHEMNSVQQKNKENVFEMNNSMFNDN